MWSNAQSALLDGLEPSLELGIENRILLQVYLPMLDLIGDAQCPLNGRVLPKQDFAVCMVDNHLFAFLSDYQAAE